MFRKWGDNTGLLPAVGQNQNNVTYWLLFLARVQHPSTRLFGKKNGGSDFTNAEESKWRDQIFPLDLPRALILHVCI